MIDTLGVLLAYSVIRAMEVFEIETAQVLEEAERTRAVMADRDRIGRELHDGTIQSIYAAGLMLESVDYLIDGSPDDAKEKLAEVSLGLGVDLTPIGKITAKGTGVKLAGDGGERELGRSGFDHFGLASK